MAEREPKVTTKELVCSESYVRTL